MGDSSWTQTCSGDFLDVPKLAGGYSCFSVSWAFSSSLRMKKNVTLEENSRREEEVMMVNDVIERTNDRDLPHSTPRVWDMPKSTAKAGQSEKEIDFNQLSQNGRQGNDCGQRAGPSGGAGHPPGRKQEPRGRGPC